MTKGQEEKIKTFHLKPKREPGCKQVFGAQRIAKKMNKIIGTLRGQRYPLKYQSGLLNLTVVSNKNG